MFSAFLAIVKWAVGHEDLIATAWKDVAALLGKHVSSEPSHEAQVALQAGLAAAAAQLHQSVLARKAAPAGPVHVDLTGNGA